MPNLIEQIDILAIRSVTDEITKLYALLEVREGEELRSVKADLRQKLRELRELTKYTVQP